MRIATILIGLFLTLNAFNQSFMFPPLPGGGSGGNDSGSTYPTDQLQAYWSLDGDVLDDHGSFDGTNYNVAFDSLNRFDAASKCGYFNGVDAYVDFGDVLDLRLTDRTVCFWTRTFVGDSSFTYLGKRTSGGDNNRWAVLEAVGATKGLFHTAATGGVTVDATTALNDNTWHFVAMEWDRSGNLSIYVDDMSSSEDAASIAAGGGTDINTAWNLYMGVTADAAGTSPLAGYYMYGIMDDVFVYNKVLTESEKNQVKNYPQIYTP